MRLQSRGSMEGWKDGRMEAFRMEGWDGPSRPPCYARMEGWKDGRMEAFRMEGWDGPSRPP